MAQNLFLDLSLIIIIATLISILMGILRQPLIIGYIITGILVAARFSTNLGAQQAIFTLSEIGVALLLFMVGLSLNPKVIKEVGLASTLTGIAQVVFTSFIGYLIATSLGFTTLEAIFIAIALTFSSTIIIMKFLSDKGDVDTLYGRISIGFLIIQDLIAIFILVIVSSIPTTASDISIANLSMIGFVTLIKGAVLLTALYYLGTRIFPKFDKYIAQSQELLFVFAIGWALALALLFQILGFSIEIGALLAGMTLAISPFHYEISAKIKPVRDFFLILFFVFLGTQLEITSISNLLFPALTLSIFILIGNPLIVVILMSLLGYTKKTSFLAGLTVAQISEFSLILIALGIKLNYLSNEILSLVTMVGLITIAGSAYMILYAEKIYPYFAGFLSIFESKGKKKDKLKNVRSKNYDVIMFGYNRVGYDLLKSLYKLKKRFLIIDFNPEVILKLEKEKINCLYGDADDDELLEELNFKKAKMIISTLPKFETNMLLLKKVQEKNKKTIVILHSTNTNDAMQLYTAGASYVIVPHFLGGHYVASLISRYKFNHGKFIKERGRHLKRLAERKKKSHFKLDRL